MKLILYFVVLTICITVNVKAQVKHVILISIDGLYPDMYFEKSWPAPNLRYLMQQGTYADQLLSVFPSYTYPSHTAIVTGALPAHSGILFNQPLGDYSGGWEWFANKIKISTLWQALKAKGKKTAAIQWPVTVGADITWNLPEIWDTEHSSDRITRARKYATPGLVEEVEVNATGKLNNVNYNDGSYSWDENSGRIAAYVFATKKPAFMAVHFANVDGFEHDFGRDADSVRLAVATDDHAIGDILEAVKHSGLKDSTAIIIVGDHGFADIHQVMRPNILIKGLPAQFVASGGSCFLYRYADTKKADVPGIIKAITDSLNKLPQNIRELFRIIDREQLNKMGADNNALMALTAQPGTVFSSSVSAAKTVNHGPGTLIQQNKLDGLLIPTHGGHHGYDPNIPEMYTGFIAAGAGIVKGGHIQSIAEPDIAALVARLLGIEFQTPDGKLIDGIIK